MITNPEYIVDKESPQEYEARADSVEGEDFYPTDSKGQTKQVVGNPVLNKNEKVSSRSIMRINICALLVWAQVLKT